MAVVSPFAWDAGSVIDLPDWMPTVSGVMFAVPAIWISGRTILDVWQRSRDAEGYSVLQLQLGLGLLIILTTTLLEVALAARIADSATYEALRNSDGSVRTTPLGFILITITGAAFGTMWLSVGSYLYCHAITSDSGIRFETRWDDPDPLGDFLHGRSPRP